MRRVLTDHPVRLAPHFSDDGQSLLEGGSYGGITVWKTLSKPFDDAAKVSYILSRLTREQLNSKTPVPPPPGPERYADELYSGGFRAAARARRRGFLPGVWGCVP